ncbi:unnamed protein product [Caenorhabditis angaria]|uniref:Uncharacterized protein n=1 Tax=Caenorhabditis angaria TaxID=860376 RepID=A0A9P1IVU7_9PELO|nr:unnamed protein product [Caenorhabditis angaria]
MNACNKRILERWPRRSLYCKKREEYEKPAQSGKASKWEQQLQKCSFYEKEKDAETPNGSQIAAIWERRRKVESQRH